ncbi:MAG: nuclear transport factor 2 family protein [Lutibacter sp.]|nr:nuclear transport factor 2 family protein [Lutibacter sp.]
MKKITLILMMISTLISYAQKKANGTIYSEHPAITAVESMEQAFVKGDADKVASFLADDFRQIYASNTNKDAKGADKQSFLEDVKFWKDNFDYLSITRFPGAYPDALEYKDGANDDVVWVQTWEQVKGVHKKTGVKLDMPFHRLFIVDKNNKIKTMMNYYDSRIYQEIGNSFADRKNGTIYNNHEYINNVRRMIYAFENKDYSTGYSFYDEKAQFTYGNIPDNDQKPLTLAQMKESDKKFFDKFEINSIDVSGYPDYLHYELGNTKVVQSWWNFRLTRKSDKKKIILPMFYIHNFNDEGKISNESAYFDESLLEK